MSTTSRATIADVAALAGVSRAAVSKVFNGRGSISEATAARIRDAAAKLNWTPSAAAVALRRSRAMTVGLAVNRGGKGLRSGSTTEGLISGIEYVLSRRAYGLLFYEFGPGALHEAELYRRLADTRQVDGVILTNSRVGDARFQMLRDIALPAVLIGTPWQDDPIPHLDADPPGAGVDEAVAHLVDIGHRRIAYVGGPEDEFQALVRRRTFDSAISAAALRPYAIIETNYTPADAATATDRLLEGPERPTAIVYASDMMAIAGMHSARTHGLQLPRDLSIIGFDGLEIGQWVEPTLTTVQRDPVGRGRAIAALLLHILGEELEEEYPLPPQSLVVRQSTAPPSL